MDKTIAININETRQNLIKICNTSSLPVCVLEMIIKDIYMEIHALSEKQLKDDTAKYMNAINHTSTDLDDKCEKTN